MEYFSLGNDCVPLIAVVGADDIIDRFDPLKANVDGSVFTITRFEDIADPGEYYAPYVADVDASIDPASGGSWALMTASVNYLYNEFDDEFIRERSNTYIEMLASAARSALAESQRENNYNSKGAHFIIDVTAIAVDATITATIQGYDELSAKYYDILIGTTITATGTYILKVYPGIGQIPNGSASDILPNAFRISVAYGGTDTITYSVGCSLIV